MLAFAQPQNTRMLQIIRERRRGKRLATLRRENLIVEKKIYAGTRFSLIEDIAEFLERRALLDTFFTHFLGSSSKISRSFLERRFGITTSI